MLRGDQKALLKKGLKKIVATSFRTLELGFYLISLTPEPQRSADIPHMQKKKRFNVRSPVHFCNHKSPVMTTIRRGL